MAGWGRRARRRQPPIGAVAAEGRRGSDVIVTDRFSLNLRSDIVVDVATLRGWTWRLIERTPTDADLCAYGWRSEFLDPLPGWFPRLRLPGNTR